MIGNREERSRYLEYLPAIYRDEDFLERFLLIFEALLSPVERQVDNLALYFDPRLTPAEYLPWLASWVGRSLDARWPLERQRELVAHSAELYRLRGTVAGLQRILSVYAGTEVRVEDSGAFVIAVTVPSDPANPPDEEVVRSIIESEKPAHAAYLLRFVPTTEQT